MIFIGECVFFYLAPGGYEHVVFFVEKVIVKPIEKKNWRHSVWRCLKVFEGYDHVFFSKKWKKWKSEKKKCVFELQLQLHLFTKRVLFLENLHFW